MTKLLMLMIALTSGSLAFGQGFYDNWSWDDGSFLANTDVIEYQIPDPSCQTVSITNIYSNLAGAYASDGAPGEIQQSTYLDDLGDTVLWEDGFDYTFPDTLGNCLSSHASKQYWLNVRKTAYSLIREEQVSCGNGCVAKQCDYVVACDAGTSATCTDPYTLQIPVSSPCPDVKVYYYFGGIHCFELLARTNPADHSCS